MGIVELRPVIGERVDAAWHADEPTVITKAGKPRAAIVPYDWYLRYCEQNGVEPIEADQSPTDPAEAS